MSRLFFSMLATLAVLAVAGTAMASDAPAITTSTIAGAEVVTVTIPATWSSAIVQAADRARFATKPERVLLNGGYFDAAGQPDGLLVDGATRRGPLRRESPYSGFLWADAAGALHIARTGEEPAGAAWAIQSGPLLVEDGRAAINRSTHLAPRSLIALRHGRTLVIRTGAMGLKELADGLAASGIAWAINLDGGPSSALSARIAAETCERPGLVVVPYLVGFAPPP